MRLKNSDLEILNQHFLFHLRPERNTFGRGEEGTEEREREWGRKEERERKDEADRQGRADKEKEEDGGRWRKGEETAATERSVCVWGGGGV